ncbi:MAG TPA: hypothetical protein VF310_07440 [Vicinamibacteria bacterium]
MNPDLDNLRRYMAIAANALERLQEATPKIESEGDTLDQLEHELDSKLSEFDSDTDGFVQDIERGETEALAEVSKLTSLAHEAAGTRLPDAEHDLEEAGNRIDQSMDAGGAELTSDHGTLDSEGFGTLMTALDAAQQAFDTTRTQNEAHFQALDQALKQMETEAEAAYNESGQELEAANTEADQEASELGTETGTYVQDMDAAGNDFHGQLGQVESEAETAYDSVNEQVNSESQELTDGVHQALEDEAKHLATDLTDQLSQSSQLVMNDSATPHLTELGSLHEVVSKAESAGLDLDPLVGDLQRCQSVVELVEKLLNAMN